jgi:hypothetical protein
LVGEVFYSFYSEEHSRVGLMPDRGKFEVIEVNKERVSVRDEKGMVLTSNVGNWNKEYIHQIFNLVRRWRAGE